MNNKESVPNWSWSELHQDLLELIASKLSYIDILRFKAVCSSWLAATERYSSGPLLIVSLTKKPDEGDVRLGAFSFKDKTTYDLNVVLENYEDISSDSEGVRFIGSSHGWLVAISRNSELYLLNLFSRTCITLPGKDTIPPPETCGPKFPLVQSPTLIQKVILTANPSLDDNYKVIITCDSRKKLAFCGSGDKKWVGFSNSEGYVDLVWHDMLLYTLKEGIKIEIWEFADSCFPTIKICVECCCAKELFFPSDLCSTQWYLVPSLGELLFIVRHIGEYFDAEEDNHLFYPYRTLKFQVYKLNMIEKKLEEVTSLKDQVIFLGGNHGISVSARDYQEFKANSIYFTDDYWDRMYEDYIHGGHDLGSFNLKDKIISPHFESLYLEKFEPTPFWVFTN